jgi:hypothetical protein
MESMRRAVPLPLILLLFSCAPPFDDELARAGQTVLKLGTGYRIGPLDLPNAYLGDDYLRFYPEKTFVGSTCGIDGSRGFFSYSDQSMVHLGFTRQNTATGGFDCFGEISSPISWYFNGVLAFQIQTVKSGDVVSVTEWNSDSTKNRQTLYRADPGTQTFAIVGGPYDMSAVGSASIGPGSTIAVNGVGHVAGVPTNDAVDMHYWLVMDETGECWELGFDAAAPPDLPATFALVRPAAADLSFGSWNQTFQYFHTPNPGPEGRSYIFAYRGDSDSWTGWWWDSVSRVQLPSISPAPVALLSTGEFFCQKENEGYVYDGDLNPEASFPMGSLRFIFETYVNGTPTVFFSLADKTHEGLFFTLYSHPTASLKSLAP